MSVESHIDTIAQKRAQLKIQIAAEMAHAHPDFTRITTLKKQNLLLKEEMQHYLRSLKKTATA